MIVALDAHYHADRTQLGLVAFRDWPDREPVFRRTLHFPPAAPYVPGRFFERELPFLLAAIDRFEEGQHSASTVVIDGYVTLDAAGRPGLGQHLYQHYDRRLPVIGVAKTAFNGADHAEEVIRGGSRRPLYVTAAGQEAWRAADAVRDMHGDHRMPDLLRLVDRLSKAES